MGALITKEMAEKRLEGRGITLLEWGGKLTAFSKFSCNKGHVWSAIGVSTFGKHGCPHCSGSIKVNFERAQSILSPRNITLVSKGARTIDKAYFKCDVCTYEWSSNLGNVLHGSGCRKCSGLIKKTKEQAQELISERGIKLIEYEGTVVGRSLFECNRGHQWLTSFSSVYSNGRGCAKCADYGFNPDKKSVFYILKIFGNKTFIGYGITNNYETRLKTHKKNFRKQKVTFLEFMKINFEKGNEAQKLENLFKVLSANHKCDITGFKTESLPIEFLPDMLELIKIHLSK